MFGCLAILSNAQIHFLRSSIFILVVFLLFFHLFAWFTFDPRSQNLIKKNWDLCGPPLNCTGNCLWGQWLSPPSVRLSLLLLSDEGLPHLYRDQGESPTFIETTSTPSASSAKLTHTIIEWRVVILTIIVNWHKLSLTFTYCLNWNLPQSTYTHTVFQLTYRVSQKRP